MDFAVPALALVFALAPGIFIWTTLFSGRSPRLTIASSPAMEVAGFGVLSILAGSVAFSVARTHVQADQVDAVLRFIRGVGPAEGTAGMGALMLRWSIGYLKLCGACLVAGSVLRRIFWVTHLDAVLPFCRVRHEWYYVLMGRTAKPLQRRLAYAIVLVSHPEESTRMFRGRIDNFRLTGDGDIRELVLTEVQRGKDRGIDFAWAPVEGDKFAILGPSIHSINIEYLDVDAQFTTRKGRIAWTWKRIWRSFLFEEP